MLIVQLMETTSFHDIVLRIASQKILSHMFRDLQNNDER